jgi:hypothetical protein
VTLNFDDGARAKPSGSLTSVKIDRRWIGIHGPQSFSSWMKNERVPCARRFSQWITFHYVRVILVLAGGLAALKTLTLAA